MQIDEQKSLVKLSMIPKVGPVAIGKIVAKYGSASNFMALPDSERNLIFKAKPDWASLHIQVEKEFAFINTNKIELLTPQSPQYPPLLNECSDRPYILFVKGNLDWLQKKSVAFVGTRSPSVEGRRKVEKIIEGLAPYDPVIVSGLAAGIDTYAHEIAIANGLDTVAILGNSLNTIYPATNRALAKKIISHGCLMTEFYSTSGVEKLNFVRRNRIIAGLCYASIIVESKQRGGALLTADFASGYNRDVFAIPGCVFNEKAIGCNNLIKSNKAAMLTEATDIVESLNWDVESFPTIPIQQTILFDMPADEQLIYDYLAKYGKVNIDELKAKIDLPLGALSIALLNLEMNGKIKSVPGSFFMV